MIAGATIGYLSAAPAIAATDHVTASETAPASTALTGSGFSITLRF